MYKQYNSDEPRDIDDAVKSGAEQISVCSCGKKHTILNWRVCNENYVFEICNTRVSKTYTIEEFVVLNSKEPKQYLWPFEDVSGGTRDLRRDIPAHTNVEICSCPLNHAYTFRGEKSPRTSPFFCKTETSWSGPIGDLLSGNTNPGNKEEIIKLKTELSASEVNLLDTIRKVYEKPPDKNIIAIVMFTQWIRAQRMPFEADRLIELYDAPKKKGIV